MSELIDNSRHRIETLKGIIRRLHDGESPETLKGEFAGLLDQVGPTEIAAMENELMADGMPPEEVQRMCDVHAAVLGDRLGGELGPEARGPPEGADRGGPPPERAHSSPSRTT